MVAGSSLALVYTDEPQRAPFQRISLLVFRWQRALRDRSNAH
jgi:hypothetical protein